ncbi:MAG: hypothetical protein HXX20_13690, partial [Chloroflexi bacterium]|nr:hypothetical protein [Chloroflexota bacterium]
MTTPERQTQLNKLLTDAEALKIDLQKKQVFSSDPKEQKRLELEIEQTRLHIEKFQAELGRLPPQAKVEEDYLQKVIATFEERLLGYTEQETYLLTNEARPSLIDLTCLRYPPKTGKEAGIFASPDGLPFSSSRPEKYYEGTLFEQVAAVARAALLGAPGAGKTTSFLRLAVRYAHQFLEKKVAKTDVTSTDFHLGKIPVLIPLGGYSPQEQMPFDYIYDFLRRGAYGYPAAPDLANRLQTYLNEGRLLLLLDAVNEVAEDAREQAMNDLKEFGLRQTEQGNSLLISCREKDYLQSLSEQPRLVLKELDDQRIQHYLSHFFDKGRVTDIETRLDANNKQLRGLVHNPFMLRVLASVYQKSHHQLPNTRGELFREFGRNLLSRALDKPHWQPLLQTLVPEQKLPRLLFSQMSENSKEVALERLALVVEPMLGQLAFNMLLDPKRGTRILQEEIYQGQLITPMLVKEFSYREQRYGPSKIGELELDSPQALWLAVDAGLLRLTEYQGRPQDTTLEFHHQLLEEYFAASYLRGLEPSSPEWRKAANRYDFDEVFPLLADLYQDPAEVIRLVWKYDFELACRCALLLPKENLSENSHNWLVAELETLLKEDFKPNWNKALQALCDLKAIPSLVAVVTKHQDSDVRRIAANALAGLGAKEAIPHLINQLRQGSYRLYTLGWYSLVA